jgi:carbamoyl-phosphate synthase small subunit
MLDDGTCFEGLAVGACAEACGEFVFATAMCGYQEILSDPAHYGQIPVFTAAHIGNYGATPQDDEATSLYAAPAFTPDATAPELRHFGAAGAVFHDLFTEADALPFPHWRAKSSLNAELAERGITGISGVDTRALTLHLRTQGARNGIISALDLDRDSLLRRAKALPSMQGRDLAGMVGCQISYAFTPRGGDLLPLSYSPGSANPAGTIAGGPPQKPLNIALLDCGVKRSTLLHLTRNNLRPMLWPAKTPAAEILAAGADGFIIAGGPGDPAACGYAAETLRELLGRLPFFGLGLGHQLLGLALGAKTYKLPCGHHGPNHPVREVATGKVSITSQNHGFCLQADNLPARLRPTHWNLNDGTLEGMAVTDVPAFSVQYNPESAPGERDAFGLFASFRKLIDEFKG